MNPPTAALLLDPKAFKNRPPSSANNGGSITNPPPRRETSIPGAPTGTVFSHRQLLDPRSLKPRNSPKRRSPATVRPSTTSSTVNRKGLSSSESTGFENSDSSSSTTNPTNNNTKDAVNNNSHNKSLETRAGMIEGMYGVEQRVHHHSHPQKRIKLNERPKNGAGSSARTPAKTSFLGGYMKENSDIQTPPPSTTSQSEAADTIDLTEDNDDDNKGKDAAEDDDVIFVANSDLGAEEVCYGKLEGATVLAHRVPKPPKSTLGSFSDWPSIRCDLLRERSHHARIEVADPESVIFGVLDADVSAALAPLLDMTVVKLRTQARLDVRRKKPSEWAGQPCSEVYRISINLYGPRRMAESTGRFLSQKNIWLGTPNSVEVGIPVVNPHAERRRLVAAQGATTAPARYTVQSETRTAEEITNAVTKMFDQLKSADNLPEMDPPKLVKTDLLQHQKQALWYMTEKESPRRLGAEEEDNNSLWRIKYLTNGQKFYQDIISGITCPEEPPQVYGGLLADMMGLGKTLSILSLVCSTLPQSTEWAKSKPEPNALLTNPRARTAKSTLLVVPLSTVGNWIGQINEHLTEGALSYYVFHGSSRTEDPEELAQYDLIITTYSTVLSDTSGKSSKRGTSPLTQLNFFRIVLDEAHAIREQSTAQSQAIFKLDAQRRWSVTGTPIQNRLDDLGSVTRFLRLYPFNDKSRFAAHIIAPFKCESPHAIKTLRVLVDSFTLRRVKDRISLPPRHDQQVMLTLSDNEKRLHEFFRKESNVMMNVLAGQNKEKISGKMYHLVLKAMMILRQISAHGKELLDPEDRERFRGLTANDAIDLEELDNDTSGVANKKAYEMLTLMRESSADVCTKCGNGIPIQGPDDTPGDKNTMVAAMLPCYDMLCADCFSHVCQVFNENAGRPVQLRCTFCKGVIPPVYTSITTAGFEKYQSTQLAAKQNRKQVKVLGQYEGPHTKTKALISRLLESAEESQRTEAKPPIKSVIFSSWTSHLDLIEIALEENQLRGYMRLDGTMSLKQRNAALDSFRDDDNITILLATLGAGGVGLNLTAASKVYIMEPQYNPAAVAQAVDRIHRLGQEREVTTVQFIMKDSIEEKIAELAMRKQQLADMSLNRNKDRREMQVERMREYRSLFK